MDKLVAYLLVGFGSALGGMGRCWLTDAITERFGAKFPWGTLLVNVTGSFAIGLFAGLVHPESRLLVHPRWSIFFMTGICGGYTTFSAFSLQTLNLMREGQWAYAGAYTVLSVFLCLGVVALGYALGAALSRP